MKKNVLMVFAAAVLSAIMGLSAYAMGWQQDSAGRYWYGTNEDNSQWCSNGWWWISGANDSLMKCYYFDEQGYMLSNTTTPDGYQVNADGQWISNGEIVLIAAPEQQVFLQAGFDYTPYLITDQGNSDGNGDASRNQTADETGEEERLQKLQNYRQDLDLALSKMGYLYSFDIDADGNTNIELWKTNFRLDNAKMTKIVPSVRRIWINTLKPAFSDLSSSLTETHDMYGLDGTCVVNLYTGDTRTLLLSYEDGECLYDYVTD
ncbi:MAG: hypothetical protein Q4C63_03620 [Eubacteriales bacterium]|nr:hypothetical protein [Eubacteriales bacterium]